VSTNRRIRETGSGPARADRSRLPDAGPPATVRFPTIEKSTLDNGLAIWTVRHTSVPLVSFVLLLARGAADDPVGKEGLAALTADMLDEGSGDRSAIQMHEALARLGTQIETDIGSDAALIGLTVLRRHAEPALGVLADMVARPALREADFARVRQLRLHRLTQLRDVPSSVADRAFFKLLYGEAPYGHSPVGTESALAGLSPDDVRAFHREAVRPSHATLIAVGDCTHESVRRCAAAVFSDWRGTGADGNQQMRSLPTPSRVNVVPRPGAPQSEVRIGHVAVARSTPDYHALVAANMVLGGQFVSRINLNLRERRGFTYGARTAFDFRRKPGPFFLQAGVQTTATATAIAESIGEIDAIRGARPVTAEELTTGVAALTRGYARNFETADQIARALTQLALYGLPDDYFAQFVPLVEQVSSGDISAVMTKHVDPARLTTVVVGDLDVIGGSLSALGLGDPVVLPAETF
jgi:predicted Zn-dependent peptidase